jgi:hypothetical protein
MNKTIILYKSIGDNTLLFTDMFYKLTKENLKVNQEVNRSCNSKPWQTVQMQILLPRD